MQAMRAQHGMHPHHESNQGHQHGQEHRHGHTDHGDHVHEVCTFAGFSGMFLQVMHMYEPTPLMQAAAEITFLCIVQRPKSLSVSSGKKKGPNLLSMQARHDVEANAVAAEGHSSDKSQLTEALIKATFNLLLKRAC